MTTKGRASQEQGSRKAKNICQLNARQVEMARPRHESEEAPGQKPEPGPSKLLTSLQDVDRATRVRDAVGQVEDLVCYVMNLADDLQAWLAEGMVAPEVLPQVVQELREIAEDLETGRPVWPAPATSHPPPPRHALARKAHRKRKSEGKIPF